MREVDSGYDASMPSLSLQLSRKGSKEIVVKIDAARLERLASTLGLYHPDFLRSLERAEADVAAGRVKRLRTMKDLA